MTCRIRVGGDEGPFEEDISSIYVVFGRNRSIGGAYKPIYVVFGRSRSEPGVLE